MCRSCFRYDCLGQYAFTEFELDERLSYFGTIVTTVTKTRRYARHQNARAALYLAELSYKILHRFDYLMEHRCRLR